MDQPLSADNSAGPDIEALSVMSPGPELSRALCRIDMVGLSAHDVVEVVRAWERQKAFDAARQLQAIARLAKDDVYQVCDLPPGVDSGHVHRAIEPCGDELSLALVCSPVRARNQVALAITLVGQLPATLRALQAGRIDAYKAQLIADRTLEQLRFDTLTGLGWTALDLGHLGCCDPSCHQGCHPRHGEPHGPRKLARGHGRAATVHVTVAASTLRGADELPAWLDGFGYVTADTGRRIAVEGPWHRLLTDPAHGQLLEYGRTTYAPPAHLASFVAARDRTCRFPTCDHPARAGEIDHKVPYAQGGTTGASNLWALDRRHHVGKTLHRYRIHTDTAGATWWTTPAGHHYTVEPETISPTIHRSATERKTTTAADPDPPPF